MTPSHGESTAPELISHDIASMPWASTHVAHLDADLAIKRLVVDPETGVTRT